MLKNVLRRFVQQKRRYNGQLIPLPGRNQLLPANAAFISALRHAGFRGEISSSRGIAAVMSTDNSFYQRFPQAVAFPKDTADLIRIMRLADTPDFNTAVTLTARGGGTGCNGQSLSDGIIVDLSRHMNRVVSIDATRRRAVVQAGAVKDQLNAAVKAHGLHFAPECSTSSRATIGGMISTDAAGQGSLHHGKTSHHVRALQVGLLGGEFAYLGEGKPQLGPRAEKILTIAQEIANHKRQAATKAFPPLSRAVTGYNLVALWDRQQLRYSSDLLSLDKRNEDDLDFHALFCGSEGTLGIVAEAQLNLEPLPKHSALVGIRYLEFSDCLRDAPFLMGGSGDEDAAQSCRPVSIEAMDGLAYRKAKEDIVWSSVSSLFPRDLREVGGLAILEFTNDDATALRLSVERFAHRLEVNGDVTRLPLAIVWGDAEKAALWNMRKRTAGLLGAVRSDKRPWPFVEDSAVLPQNFAAYVTDLSRLLDSYGLDYGMFGHLDAGILHVRPLLDVSDPDQGRRVREISEAVSELALSYGGIMWGEHGKGLRSEFLPKFWGPEIWPLMCAIKAAADPRNQLNPGKVAVPVLPGVPLQKGMPFAADPRLLRVDEVPLRGQLELPRELREWGRNASYCNGNAACFSWDPREAMCPSWKASRDRRWSPKGRAALWREWTLSQVAAGQNLLKLREQLLNDHTNAPFFSWLRKFPARAFYTAKKAITSNHLEDLGNEMFESFERCLGCRACAGQCPLQIDIPHLKSEFLNLWHGWYLRGMRDVALGSLEPILQLPLPWKVLSSVWNLSLPFINSVGRVVAGMDNLPAMSNWQALQRLEKWPTATVEGLLKIPVEDRVRNTVVVVPDCFSSFFDADVLADTADLLELFGFNVLFFRNNKGGSNGKALHVSGQLAKFIPVATKQAAALSALAATGTRFVGVDPAMALVYRNEYAQHGIHSPHVQLLQELLAGRAPHRVHRGGKGEQSGDSLQLLLHCTEQVGVPESGELWKRIFATSGLSLNLGRVGCCGMAGTFGHILANRTISERCYDMSWRPLVEGKAPGIHERVTSEFKWNDADAEVEEKAVMMASGYSCRSQVKKLSGKRLPHPAQVLLQHVKRKY